MNNKKYKIISGGVLVIALVAMLGIVYAAYSQTLNINGDATVKANSWNVHFANLSEAQLTGEAKELTAPTIKNNSTTIGDYSVLLSKPGDRVKYTFDVANDGTFNAGLYDINISKPICTGTGEKAEEDATKVCKHLIYKVRHQIMDRGYILPINNPPIYYKLGDALGDDGFCTILPPKDKYENYKSTCLTDIDDRGFLYEGLSIILYYDQNVPAEDLPKNDVAISNLGVEFIFTQVD